MKMNLIRLVICYNLCLLMGFQVFSQVTTSGMSGIVADQQGEPLPGATVVAVHQPSGTQYGTITNNEGRFNLQGMRPGGPYTLNVSFVGFSSEKYSDIMLLLGESFSLNTLLRESTLDVGEVMVIGARPSAFGAQKTGASSNINSQQMSMIPSLNRNLGDYTKMSPFATGTGSYIGREAYTTNITVDGANFNNNFGLSGSNMPGIYGEPISMDAIEEIQVAVAPFDVRQSNFTGAGVNAITKSGTNTVRGSAYGYYRDQSMNGKKVRDKELTITESSKKTYGVYIGGPIIENKLFYFISGEMEKSLTPGNTLLAMDAGRDAEDPNVNARVNAAELQRFSNILKSKYDYETGRYENWGGDDEYNNKLLGKIDWNINDDHKLTARYNYSESSSVSRPSNSGDVSPSISGGRHARTGGISFENSQYYSTNQMHSVTGELNSKMGLISNKFLIAFTKYHQPRASDSEIFPFIDIMNGNPAAGDVKMSAGYELFSFKNQIDNNTLILTDNATYLLNKHTFTLGISYEHQYFANSYLRQGSSYYRFKDLDAFERYVNNEGAGLPYNDNYHPTNFAYTYPINGFTNPVAELAFGQFSSYAQDEWSPADNLKVTAGLRIDVPMYLDGALDNPNVRKYSYRDGETVNLGSWPDVKILWSPRLGFNWDVKGDRSLRIRGGTGIFTGRIPFVWFTNQPSNSGMIQYRLVMNQSSGDNQKNMLARLPMYKDAAKLLDDTALSDIFPQSNPEGGSIAAIDKDFKLPQVWRSSLGVDMKLPLEMTLTVEGIYTKDINGIYFDNINLKPAESTLEEGTNKRPYWSNNTTATKYYTPPYTDVIIMRNSNTGQGYTLSAELDLPDVAGFSGMIAYSRSWSEEVTGKNGSDPLSAWRYRSVLNSLNDQEVGLTMNNMPHRIFTVLNYSVDYSRYFSTTVSLIYSGNSGYAYSHFYRGDANRDGTSDHELMYIPKNRDELLWETPEDADAYFAFAAKDPYLSANSGKYAERYAAYMPWYNQFDLRIMQNFIIKTKGISNTLQLSADVVNFGNMINSAWGLRKELTLRTNASNNSFPLQVVGKDAETGMLKVKMQKIGGEYVKEPFQDPSTVAGTWGLQLGIRYFFN